MRTPFVELLAKEMVRQSRVQVLNLRNAVEMCYWIEDRHEDEAMRELELATRGQAFRYDTAAGPIFLDLPLWRFARYTGPGPLGECRKFANPHWSKLPLVDYAQAAADRAEVA